MTIRNLSLVVISTVLMYSCNKDESTSTFQRINSNDKYDDPNAVKYNPGNDLLIDNLAIYTSDGAHKDPQLIRDFLKRNFPNYEKYFFVEKSTVSDHIISTALSFLENNRVRLNGVVMEIVSRTDKELLVSPLDSTNMPGNQGLGRCSVLYAKVPQHNPYSICSTAGGNCKKYREVYPVIISGNDYYLPMLQWAIVSNCNIFSYKSSPMPYYFNNSITSELVAGKDSVLVQSSRLPLLKK